MDTSFSNLTTVLNQRFTALTQTEKTVDDILIYFLTHFWEEARNFWIETQTVTPAVIEEKTDIGKQSAQLIAVVDTGGNVGDFPDAAQFIAMDETEKAGLA
jgi:hypothetical protein